MFAAYVLCGAQQMDAVRLTLEQIDVVRRMCTENPEFELVTSTQGIIHLYNSIMLLLLNPRSPVELFVFIYALFRIVKNFS